MEIFHVLVEVECDPIALRGELTGRFKIFEEKDLSRFGVIISDGKVCVVPGGLIRLLQDKTFPVKLFEIDPRTWIFPAFLCRAGAQWVPGGDNSDHIVLIERAVFQKRMAGGFVDNGKIKLSGKQVPLKGCKSKAGKTFDCKIRLEKDGDLEPIFDNKPKGKYNKARR